MILVTGGAGFIGSALVWGLNLQGHRHILVTDRLGLGDKWKNLVKREVDYVVPKDQFFTWLQGSKHPAIQAVLHMGACSSTTERDGDFLMDNNVLFTKKLWDYCTELRIPFFYASSAATYGAEEENFSDAHGRIPALRPINKYGWSKQLFDVWALKQHQCPPAWYGFKFFNVYGPGEQHKGPQSSVVFHAFPQVRDQGSLRLFKSYRPEIGHGEQKRDFVYVKDVVKVILHFLEHHRQIPSGLYNLGTGQARSFVDLGSAVYDALGKKPRFDWIEMPESLKNQYQYFTEADLSKLRKDAGYQESFSSLEEGVRDYVQNYLNQADQHL
jgi:ADP-L-glycero-D-manno-heptose 6-epimerase